MRDSQPSEPEFQLPPPLAKSLVLMLKLAIVDRMLNNSSVEAKSQRHSQKQAYGGGEAGVTVPSLFFFSNVSSRNASGKPLTIADRSYEGLTQSSKQRHDGYVRILKLAIYI